ncbi:two-component system, chemotaxis family, sensor kinase CheA [Tistlia consotensis]|uniref:Chemotaxis protein CheA n=1 Tax=Tistlia consotensis USBA 355 TaxID=560819 RepID=A0A1Y6CLV0_9PROT|nr:chemotaxis protein CheW [Tistlia consotensis]SMF76363.1 two-component system, chemotaxis family, sensor kinase CheA [Tistlia consotensis USBA 355]SNS12743.1 two-component system, chemotaxis family, sensor kinase CheA [Tistlia consotensis]
MDELLSEFLTETNEGLGFLDVELVKLEQNPNDPEILSNIFRLVHTIKGTCGFLGLPRLESVAHAGENVLGRVRDGELVVTPGIVTTVLDCLDRIREILGVLEATEAEPEGDDSELIGRLDAICEQVDSGELAPADEPAEVEVEIEEPVAETVEDDKVVALETPVHETAAAEPAKPTKAAKVEPPVAEPAHADVAEHAAPEHAAKESAVANQSIRVNVELLENLMTMVSELVLTRNQLLQILRQQKETDFAAPLQRLNHVVSELQEGVMKTRMQPIGNAWAKLPRIVRDLSLELGKKVELVMNGADTELDRQVLELIKDPLTHMVRNSADHGLEDPAERRRSGKSDTGTITLNAYHEGGHIIIEIADDGRGLNIDKIKAKALSNGVTNEAEMAGMSDQQIMQFIFKAGFSTAEKVTSVSGRGVGMDVVRTNIERIGGTIELNSITGRGSKFTIKIPLTLAIVSALIVECAEERFAIPQLSVIELVRASSKSEHRIERIKDTPVLRLRNRLLPLVNLRELLGLDNGFEVSANDRRDGFIVVAQVGTYNFGIIVDRVFDTEEIVVKPVAPILRDIALFSGNTILGDGSVVMILDPNGIAAATGEITVSDDRQVQKGARSRKEGEQVSLLVFRSGDTAPKAVPLALVARLEEVDLASVESSNGQQVVQYRGQLMPLVSMEEGRRLAAEGRQPVLVFADRDRHVGLAVDEIVDIVQDRLKIELTAERTGFIGSAVIAGKATDIVDTGFFLTKAYSDWFGAEGERMGDGNGKRILLVDDSPFFRNLMAPLLQAAGYEVTTVSDGSEALALCEAGEEFDAIVSDIEMPGIDGFELARQLRDNRWSSVPLVALTSHASPSHMARGREAGFTDYVAKFDRNALLTSLHDTLSDVRGAA